MGSSIDLSSYIRSGRVVFVSLPMVDLKVFHQPLLEMRLELILFAKLSLNSYLAFFLQHSHFYFSISKFAPTFGRIRCVSFSMSSLSSPDLFSNQSRLFKTNDVVS